MKCPNCNHISKTALLQCSNCGEAYDRLSLETLQHLEYLLSWLDSRAETLDAATLKNLRAEALAESQRLLDELLPAPEPATVIETAKPSLEEISLSPDAQRELALILVTRALIPSWIEARLISAGMAAGLHEHLTSQAQGIHAQAGIIELDLPKPVEAELYAFALDSLDRWIEQQLFTKTDASQLRDFLRGRSGILLLPEEPVAPVPVAISQATAPAVRRPVIKAAPPRPPRPPFDWGKLWGSVVEAAVSGLLLRWLRFLGAFLFVVSLAIVVVSFWTSIPPWGQLGIIFFIPTAFYAGGWYLRAKMQIEQTGSVLMGVGELVLAVAFAAIYQFSSLTIPLPTYWLATSAICTTVYVLTTWRLVHSEFFSYISLVGISSTLMALGQVLHLPIEWQLVILSASSLGMVETSARFKGGDPRWGDVSLGARRFPQLLLLLVLGLLLLIPGEGAYPAQAVGFALGVAACGLLAWRFPHRVYAHLAGWGSILAIGLSLRAASIPWHWYPSAAAVLSPIYTLTGMVLSRRIPESFQLRTSYQLVFKLAGFSLLAVGIAAGVATLNFVFWSGVVVLAVASIVMAVYAPLLRQPLFVLGSSGLLFLPFSLSVFQWLSDSQVAQPGTWLMAACAGLALVYLGIGSGLRRLPRYAEYLHLLSHMLAPLVAIGLLVVETIARSDSTIPSLVTLSGVLLVYVISAVQHDSQNFPGLSRWVSWLPDGFRRSVFLYPIGVLIPIWVAVAWSGSVLTPEWLGVALAGIALCYAGVGQFINRRQAAYRLPFHLLAYPIGVAAVWAAFQNQVALVTTLYLNVAALVAMAASYRRFHETALAGLLLLWPFQLSLNLSQITPHAQSLAYTLLVGLGYTPLGMWLQKRGDKFLYLPVYLIGYGISIYALAVSLLGRFGAYPLDLPWIGTLVPLLVTGLYSFSAYWLRKPVFAWGSAATFTLAFGQALTLVRVPAQYDASAWVVLGMAYILLASLLRRSAPERSGDGWLAAFRLPLNVGAWAVVASGVLLTSPATLDALFQTRTENLPATMLAQWLAVAFVVMSTTLYRNPWPLLLEPPLAFIPVTLLFIGYGERMLGQALSPTQFGVVWAGLGLVHFGISVGLDQARSKTRVSPAGVYLGGYAMSAFSVLWTILDRGLLLWALGLWVFTAVSSAWLVHLERHTVWADLVRAIFGSKKSALKFSLRAAFLWLAAWPFPVWLFLLLAHLGAVESFQWLAFGLSGLFYVGLAVWLRPVERTYAWPFTSAGHFYTILGLSLTAPLSGMLMLGGQSVPGGEVVFTGFKPEGKVILLGYTILQAMGVVFYGASSWFFRWKKWASRLFSYLAAFLSFVPFTLAWIVFGFDGLDFHLAYTWIGLATVLLGAGLWLDGIERRVVARQDGSRLGYAHGPYVVGYLLAAYALVWSWSDRLINIYTMAGVLLLALASHIAVHYGKHHSLEDFLEFFWRKGESVAKQGARLGFMFVAVYGFPIWLMLVLSYNQVPLAWRGLALALIAPLYVALGIGVRTLRREYTWPLYSAGYALTAIGAMVSFENPLLAIYTLSLNAVVYAVSSYVFRQAFWLYLSTLLTPVIALLTLNYTARLTSPWVASIFMLLAFVYIGIGLWLDAKKARQNTVTSYTLPFYGPGYLLSAVALAVASADRLLAIEIYLAGVVLYALSAWAFREAFFLYPAVWLAAVPYYLGMTYTHLSPGWYGVGWLPLISVAISLGRFVFHRKPDLRSVVHPAMSFYTLGYTLSLSMVFMSREDITALTVAFTAASLLYLASAGLFRRAWWLYPGLLAAHLALLAYFAIEPSGRPASSLSLPFHGITWVMGLLGGVLWAKSPREKTNPFNLLTRHWAVPFLVFAFIDSIGWQTVALFDYKTGILVGIGNAALAGVLAVMWLSALLVWGSLGFLILAIGLQLVWLGYSVPTLIGIAAGIGFGLYLVGRLLAFIAGSPGLEGEARSGTRRGISLWAKPLTWSGFGINVLAALATLPFIISNTLSTAAGLAFAGALYLAEAYRGRYYRLGYLAVALLEAAFVLVLMHQDVRQPQWYAIPSGLYLVGIGFFERRQGRRMFALLLETFGLVVLLVTSFIQSLNTEAGFWYFLLLLVEALLAISWGAGQRRKLPFLIGLAASLLNVIGQVVVLFLGGSTLIRWLIFGGVGLLILLAAVYAERWIIPRAQELRVRLEAWE